MEELAVIPECFVDTCLTETITNANHFNHQKGCGTVSKLMQGKLKDKFALGIIDKDKKLLPYLNEFDMLGNKGSIYLYKHRNKSHYIIQIFPAIEIFILQAVDEKGINLADYNLQIIHDARKAYNGVLNIRIPSDVHSKVAIIADELGTSINNFIKEAIEKEIEFAH